MAGLPLQAARPAEVGAHLDLRALFTAGAGEAGREEMMGAVLAFTTSLEPIVCHLCGVQFAIPPHMLATLRESKGVFYCPSGHAAAFVKSRADQLQLELNAEKNRAEQARNEAVAARIRADNAEGREWAVKKKLARLKNGVCPCCNRSFVALQRHMKTKHPGFKP